MFQVLEYGLTNLGELSEALKSGAVNLAHLPHSALEVRHFGLKPDRPVSAALRCLRQRCFGAQLLAIFVEAEWQVPLCFMA